MSDYDRRRAQTLDWRAWYALPIWRKVIRPRQLLAVPYCEYCYVFGRVKRATIVNHNPPHRGVWTRFIGGPFESVCKTCHDSRVQRAEARGYRILPSADTGWPMDPAHPFNRKTEELKNEGQSHAYAVLRADGDRQR